MNISEKQSDLIRQVVAEIDTMIEDRSGRSLPEFALHHWHDRLLKLCQDFAAAAQQCPPSGCATAVMISSPTMPPAEYSCFGSPLMFWNGNTAIDGFSGRDNAADSATCPEIGSGMRATNASTGRATFFRLSGPSSSNTNSRRPCT
jgi:hypothetical protein